MVLLKLLIFGVLGISALYIMGLFPGLTVGVVSLGIVFMFLIFGKE